MSERVFIGPRNRRNIRNVKQLVVRGVLAAVMLLVVEAILIPGGTQAQIYHPRSTIDRPPGKGPAFLLGIMGLGGALNYDGLGNVYGGAILLRPNRAADLVGPFYDWNTGALLRITHHYIGEDRALIAADAVARHYLADMRGDAAAQSFFVGGGIGVARSEFAQRMKKSFTWPLEVGWEYGHDSGALLTLAVEYRYTNGELGNYTAWALRAGLGIPLPW